MKSTHIFILTLIWLLVNPSLANNDVNSVVSLNLNIEQLIEETDQLKTSNSVQFKKNLKTLKNQRGSVTQFQQDFIQYLAAYNYVLDGNFLEAQQQLKGLSQSTSSLEIKIRAKATLANIQAISMEYNKALINIDYVMENVNELNDKVLINKINLISSIVYYQLDIYEMSLKYAEILVDAEPDPVMQCKGMVYEIRSKFALNITQQVSDVYQVINLCNVENQIIYAALLELDWIYLTLDKAVNENNEQLIVEQLEKVKLIENKIDDFGYNNLIGLKDMLMAKAYYHNGQVESAVEKANLSISGSAQSGVTEQVLEARKILQNIALNEEDFERAFKISQQIREAENALNQQAKSKQMAYMAVKHDNLTKQIEIQQLKQNNDLLSLENKLSVEKSRKQQLVMLLAAIVLILLGVWSYKIKKKHDYFKGVADIDHLTKVFTRKAFEEKVNVMLNDCQSENKPLNVAIMDLDHFKSVNDRFGHLVGDWVLKHVVLCCEEVADEDILVARLGGEEFCIVSPDISQSKMVQLMEKMRKATEYMDCSGSGATFSITASFGVSSTLVSGYHLPTLLRHADLALFQAKNGGRNQVITYENKNAVA